MLPLTGLTQGAQPIVSYNFGARNPERVRKTFKLLFTASVTYTALLWLMVMLFPQVFAMVFNNKPEFVEYTAWALRIYMATSGLFGIQIACQQTFIAIGNAKASIFLAVLRKIILLIPLIYILPHFFADKAFAVFLAEPIADLIAVICTGTLFRMLFGKALKALETPETQEMTP